MSNYALQLFAAQSGQLSAKVVIDENTTRHIHSLVKPEEESNYFRDLTFWGDLIILAGTGLGYHLSRKLTSVPASSRIIAIEYYTQLLGHFRSSLLNNCPGFLDALSSEDYAARKETLAETVRALDARSIQVVKHPASYRLHRDFYDAAVKELYVAATARSSRPTSSMPRCLVPVGSFFLQREITVALAEAGITSIPFRYEHSKGIVDYESKLQKLIEEQRPDFALSVNMKGFDGSGILPQVTSRRGIPLAVWFVDDPHPILLHQAQFVQNHMVAFTWEKRYAAMLHKSGFSRVSWLPLASGISKSLAASDSPRCKLGFVGTSMAGKFLRSIQEKFLWSDSLSPLVDTASDMLCADRLLSPFDAVNRAAKQIPVEIPFSDERNITWLCSLAIHTASMKQRAHSIRDLLDMGMETFGDPEGWRESLGPSTPAHPNIDYDRQLPDTYRSIAVNINITSRQMPTAVNQRVFDIPMAGSFVLSDNQEDMAELFELEKEAIVYKDIGELREKIAYFVTNSSERLRVRDAACKRILAQHTYRHRIDSILREITGH